MRSLAKYLLPLCAAAFVRGYSVLTLAGDGTVGFGDGVGLSSKFSAPRGLACDISGNLLVVDTANQRIRKISLWDRIVTTFVGSTGGYLDGANALFSGPIGITKQDLQGFYVTEHGNQRIRRMSLVGFTSTIAGTGAIGSQDGAGSSATLNYPNNLCYDNSTGNLFVSENALVRRITPAGIVSTFATIGGCQTGIALDNSSNIFVADEGSNQADPTLLLVRKISPAGIVTVFAGSGTTGFFNAQGTNAMFNGPHAIAFDAFQNLMVVERYNHAVRQISPSGIVTTIAGTGTSGWVDGLGVNAVFNNPEGIAVDRNGNIYVADTGGNRIRMIVPCDGGFFVQNATCQTCPAGTYSPFARFGNSSCIPCGAASFSAAGSASCSVSCGSGFAAGAGSAACFPIRSTTIPVTTIATTPLPSSTLPSDVISTFLPSSSLPTDVILTISSMWTTTSNRESLYIQTTVATTMLNAAPSSADLRLENGSSGIDSRIVIYASASVGAAALVGATVFLVQRRRKANNSRLKPEHNTAANELYPQLTQLSANMYNGQTNSSYNPNMSSNHSRTSSNQATALFGPPIGQSHSPSGWTASSYGPVGDFQHRHSISRASAPPTQFGHLPNLTNVTMYNRSQNQESYTATVNPGVSLKFPGNTQTTQNHFLRTSQGHPGMTDFSNTRMTGNTVTSMARTTMQF